MGTFLISKAKLLSAMLGANCRCVHCLRLIKSILKLGLILLLCQTAAVEAATIVTPLAASPEDSFFVEPDGSLWGMGNSGSFGTGSSYIYSTNRPEQLILSDVAAVVAAGGYAFGDDTFILRSDGSLWGTGDNSDGQLGIGWVPVPVPWMQIVPIGVTAVTAGGDHTLFVKSDGSLWGMGANFAGQLGEGSPADTNRPEEIISNGVVAAAAGYAYSLFVKSDGSLWGMGDNNSGQLGEGTFNDTNKPVEIISKGVVAVAAGLDHSLFVKSDGSLWSMGYNFFGQLGDGTFNDTNRPVEIVSNGVVAVAAGFVSTLFVKSDGSLWGMGSGLAIGDGNTIPTNRPVEIVSHGVAAIACGPYHSLFFKSDGSLWAMGGNTFGQLGNGSNNYTLTPVKILPPSPRESRHFHTSTKVTKVAAGGGFNANGHSLFIEANGSLWAMGDDNYGELGDGHSPFRIPNRPEKIVSSGVVSVAAGEDFSLFVKSDGSLWGMGNWGLGDNVYGPPGDGALNDAVRPVEIVSNNVIAVAAGWNFSIFTKSDGSLWGVGVDRFGQLGDGTFNYFVNKPEEIVSSGVVAVAAGYDFSLFLKSNGSLWGMGNGLAFGDGNSGLTSRPVEVVSNGVVAVTAGADDSYFIKSDGSLWEMGYGLSYSPEELISNGVVSVTAGFYNSFFIKSKHPYWYYHVHWPKMKFHHRHFLKSGGSLWGLGDIRGTEGSYAYQPELIVSNGVVAVAAGDFHSLFIKSDGSLWAMGDDQSGQLGDGFGGRIGPLNQPFPEQIVPALQPVLTDRISAKTNLQFQAACKFGGPFYLLASTNLSRPLRWWVPVGFESVSNRNTINFNVTVTNALNSSPSQVFYRLESP